MFISHVDFQCADFAASTRFYDAVLKTLGGARIMDFSPSAIAYGYAAPPNESAPEFWISAQQTGAGFRESHIAFRARTEKAVDEFLAAAIAQGVEVLHAARDWPEYQGGPVKRYYAAFVRDPDGNNVEAVYLEFDFGSTE